ncbi:ac52 [Erannis ankeraria nucleopolyhedrovirus]|uniref:ac52 n=1 Tax=Erannis ankeraria nucleopolyhedrovirus TaxID=2913600 RepID=UPI001179AFC5|nr:ac52 [Erannis ankeraria nucleopolyhedrovirus]UJZ89053.1 ac52 [Erannis ankeraria nucleopolyhedrovirus]
MTQIMELIKPFVKYSKNYRECDDVNKKAQIYNRWHCEATLVVAAKSIEDCNNDCDVCDFCYANVIKNSVVCRHCLFPLRTNFIDEELAMYTLLSVCYYEENYIKNNFQDQNSRNVWKQRLIMTWKMYDNCVNENKIYNVTQDKCMQCGDANSCIDGRFEKRNFSFNLFCKTCLFPLFQIVVSDS